MARLAVENDRQIYFERHQPQQGRPVILIPGWGMNSRVWDGVLPHLLENGNDVVLLDQRCTGMSDKDFDDVSIDALGSDVVRLVEELDLDAVVIDGWSLGGAVAMGAASKLGARCSGVVSTCGASPRYTQSEGWPYGATEDVVVQTVAALRADRANFLHGLASSVCHADVGIPTVEWMWQIFMQASAKADESLADLGRVDQRDIVRELTIPAAVMYGEHDVIVSPEIAIHNAELLVQGQLIAFESSGHAPFIEERVKYCSELLGFINGLE
jgi:pimeloyl-ACP methyl ester carboxylesterase